ncbi:MAG: butyryl-CoA dehydrogenase [Actinomycetota bacterium]|nr:butyryl-CoA dehydrogenase [Actinomycetota bacterium]
MDLRPTEEQQSLVEVLHDFAASEVRRAARACEEAGEVAGAIRAALVEMGVSTGVAEAFGGQGTFDAVTGLMIAEELAWGDPGVAYSVLAPGVVASVLQRAATPEQQADLLPGLAAGGRAALALAEREAGADIFRMDTTADTGRLHGVKYAVPDPGPAGSLIVVAEGPSIWRAATGAWAEAVAEDKLGLRSARTLKIALDGMGAEEIGTGTDDVVAALLAAKLVTAGIALGLARAAVEYAAAYARERTAFGRPIGAFQGISFMIADRATDLDAARLLCWEAGWALDAARPGADRLVMAACGQAVAAAVAASDDAVQVLGGHGYMRDHPVELWYRDAMTLATLDAPWLIGDLFLAGRYQAGGLP